MVTLMARVNFSQKQLKIKQHWSSLNLLGSSQKYSATESLTDFSFSRSVSISARQTSASWMEVESKKKCEHLATRDSYKLNSPSSGFLTLKKPSIWACRSSCFEESAFALCSFFICLWNSASVSPLFILERCKGIKLHGAAKKKNKKYDKPVA